jgi:hypothetical protein
MTRSPGAGGCSLQKLDAARKVDPDGERETRVKEYRQRAEGATSGP